MRTFWTYFNFLVLSNTLIPNSACGQAPDCIAEHARNKRAAYLLHLGNAQGAFAALDSNAKGNLCDHWTWIEATNTALSMGDTSRAVGYLEKLYAWGGQPMLTYSDPIKGLLAKGFAEHDLVRLQDAQNKWADRADSTWIQALKEMHALDQSHRAFDALTQHNDSVNLERLIQLTEERGFPSPGNVGASFGTVTLLLLHHRAELKMNDRLRHFVSLAQKAIEDCRIEPSFLTWIFDFEAREAGEPTPYGTLTGYFRNDLEQFRLPDLATLNANRARVGLLPIQQEANLLGIQLEDLPLGK